MNTVGVGVLDSTGDISKVGLIRKFKMIKTFVVNLTDWYYIKDFLLEHFLCLVSLHLQINFMELNKEITRLS